MSFSKGSILRCVTPSDNKLIFIYIDDDTYLEMVDAKSCIRITDEKNIFNSNIFPIINGEFLDGVENDLTIVFDKVYVGNAKCIFTLITEFPEGDYNEIFKEYQKIQENNMTTEFQLSDRIQEDTLFSAGVKAIYEHDISSFSDIYNQFFLMDSKIKLFFESVDSLNLPCLNICLKNGVYVDVRDDDGLTGLSKLLSKFDFTNDDENIDNDTIDICKRLVLSGASVDVALTQCDIKRQSWNHDLISVLKRISKYKDEINESGDEFE